jgi:long-chain fatty acid transport protein
VKANQTQTSPRAQLRARAWSRRLLGAGAVGLMLAGAARSDAAGLARPNVVGARAVGLGGAYTAIADDPSAAWHNPSGIVLYGENVVLIDGAIAFTERSYTPDAQSVLGQAGITRKLTESTGPTFVPTIGASTRFGFGKSPATRFAFGFTAYDAYGGSIAYKASDLSPGGKIIGINNTSIIDFELAPTLAYQINEVLSVGAALRIGINSFTVKDTETTLAADLSGEGVGIGASLGVMVKPHPMLQVGAVYRTPLSATISGTSPVAIGSAAPSPQDFTIKITWPQSAGLGVAVTPHRRILISVQGDWTGWSSVQKLDLVVAGAPQPKQMRYRDSWSAHVGLQGAVTRFLVLRLGWSWDSNAVPDYTTRRENIDAAKSTISGGIGLHIWKIFIDAAVEAFLPLKERTVSTSIEGVNETGRYGFAVYTAELGAQIRF